MNNHDKPVGAQAGWQLRKSDIAYQSKVFRLRRDELVIGETRDIVYDYQQRGEAVIVVPLTRAGEIVLIRQYRYPVDAWCMEVPAGGCGDSKGLSLEEVVRKELGEELGATCGALLSIGSFYTYPPMSDEECHVFLALGVKLSGSPDREATEMMELHPMPAREALRMARTGQIKTAPCALALLLCESAILEALESGAD